MNSPKIKIAFFGTPGLTIPILEEMKSEGFLPSLLVTMPDAPQGRKMVVTPPPAKTWAEENNIPVLQPEKLDDSFFSEYEKYSIEMNVVVAYGKIMLERLINFPKYGTLNVHYSLLPKYRGATPVESAILNGDKETGVCVQRMKYELDTGDVVLMEKVEIGNDETAPNLRTRLNEIGKKTLIEAIKKIIDSTATYTEQNEADATHCKKIKKEDGEIQETESDEIKYRKFKAYFGWPGIFFFAENKERKIRVKITDAEFSDGKFVIKKVIPEGKKEMQFQSFLNGLK